MNQQFIIYASELLVACSAGIGVMVILAASIYDMRAIARRRHLQMVAAALRKPRQLHVTVLVYVKNNSGTIEACLKSIWRSRYRNYDIVVIDNGSTDAIKQTIQNYRQTYPKRPLYFYKKRKVHDRLTALRQGYGKSQKGDSILVLDATATISPMLIREAVTQFIVDGSLQALRLNEYDYDIAGVALLFARLMQLSRNLYLKSTTLLSVAYIATGQPSTLYRKLSLIDKRKTTKVRCRYNGMIAVSTPSTSTVKLPLFVFVLSLLFITYSIYIAATLQSSSLLVFSWLIFTVWLLVTVWSDEASNIRKKIIVTFCLPPVYFLVYFWLIARGLTKGVRTIVDLFVVIVGRTRTQLAEQLL